MNLRHVSREEIDENLFLVLNRKVFWQMQSLAQTPECTRNYGLS